jgi:hypothetical protein
MLWYELCETWAQIRNAPKEVILRKFEEDIHMPDATALAAKI